MGKDCCNPKVQHDCHELPCNEYYLFNCQAEKCSVDCCGDHTECGNCVEHNTLKDLQLTELAPTPVGHGCCVPSFPPVIQHNAQRYCRCPEKLGPFASSNLCACEHQGAFDCRRAATSAGRTCPPPALQKLVEYRGDRSASGLIRMAKLQAMARATGPIRGAGCVGGCNTPRPARSYPAIGGPVVSAQEEFGPTTTYCPRRFANQQRTDQFLVASSFSALRPTGPSEDSKCPCN